MLTFIAQLGQWVGMVTTGLGDYMLIHGRGQAWEIVVTSGSLFFAIATKVRYYGTILLLRYRRRQNIKVLSQAEERRTSEEHQ